MSYSVKLSTNLKRDDRTTYGFTNNKYLLGKFTPSGWEWEYPEVEESFDQSDLGTIMIFADGMDGEIASEDASQVALDTLRNFFTAITILPDSPELINQVLRKGMMNAHHAIVEHINQFPDKAGIGTNVFIKWIVDNKMYAGWSGDSHFYLFRGDYLTIMEGDQFHMWSMIGEDGSAQDDYNHQSLGSAGHPPKINIQVHLPELMQTGDSFFFVSHHFHQKVSDKAKAEIFRQDKGIHNLPTRMVQAANDAGGLDNNTVWITNIESIQKAAKKGGFFKKRVSNPILAAVSAVVLAFSGGFFFKNKKTPPKDQQAVVTQYEKSETANEANLNVSPDETVSVDSVAAEEETATEEATKDVVPESVPKAFEEETKASEPEPAKTVTQNKSASNTNSNYAEKRRKQMLGKIVDWNDKKFHLYKKLNHLEVVIPKNDAIGHAKLKDLKLKREQLHVEYFKIIKRNKDGTPMYGANNQVQLRSNMPLKTIEKTFWRMHHGLEGIEKEYNTLCEQYICKE